MRTFDDRAREHWQARKKFRVKTKGKYNAVPQDFFSHLTYLQPKWYRKSTIESMDDALRQVFLPGIQRELNRSSKLWEMFS